MRILIIEDQLPCRSTESPEDVYKRQPLIALDMYEHSYHMDFGAKAGAYVDAFMQNLSWTTAEAAFTRLGA